MLQDNKLTPEYIFKLCLTHIKNEMASDVLKDILQKKLPDLIKNKI